MFKTDYFCHHCWRYWCVQNMIETKYTDISHLFGCFFLLFQCSNIPVFQYSNIPVVSYSSFPVSQYSCFPVFWCVENMIGSVASLIEYSIHVSCLPCQRVTNSCSRGQCVGGAVSHFAIFFFVADYKKDLCSSFHDNCWKLDGFAKFASPADVHQSEFHIWLEFQLLPAGAHRVSKTDLCRIF